MAAASYLSDHVVQVECLQLNRYLLLNQTDVQQLEFSSVIQMVKQLVQTDSGRSRLEQIMLRPLLDRDEIC